MKNKLIIILTIAFTLLLTSCRSVATTNQFNSEISVDTENSSGIANTEDTIENDNTSKKENTIENDEISNVENTISMEEVKKLFEDVINYENWFSEKWSTVWGLNNAGKIKADFYYDPEDDSIYAYIDKKLPLDDKKGYVLLFLIKDAYGYGDKPNTSLFLTLNDLESEIKSMPLVKIGNDFINIKEAYKPNLGEITQAKSILADSVEEYIKKALKEENKKGNYTIYICNFKEGSWPILNVIIQGEQGEKWYGAYEVPEDGSVSSVLPNDYEPIETEDMEYYANQVKQIAITRQITIR